jgi:hypothetical protein
MDIALAIERLAGAKHDVPAFGVVADHERLDMIEATPLTAATHWRSLSSMPLSKTRLFILATL